MEKDTLKQIEFIYQDYRKRWLKDEYEDQDDLIGDLLNELEDLYNPGRLNGN